MALITWSNEFYWRTCEREDNKGIDSIVITEYNYDDIPCLDEKICKKHKKKQAEKFAKSSHCVEISSIEDLLHFVDEAESEGISLT